MAQQTFNNTKINVEFDEATSRQQLNSGENISTLFGKIKKIFSDLKALAFKENVSATYKPEGSVSQPTFTGTKANISSSYTPSGTVSISEGTGIANYTPKGTVSKPTVSVSVNTTSVKPFGSAGTLPSCTLPSWSASVSDETLILSWSDGTFSAGTLPSAGTAVTVATGIKSATATQPTFTGEAGTATGEYTPSGTVSKPTFSGTSATITSS